MKEHTESTIANTKAIHDELLKFNQSELIITVLWMVTNGIIFLSPTTLLLTVAGSIKPESLEDQLRSYDTLVVELSRTGLGVDQLTQVILVSLAFISFAIYVFSIIRDLSQYSKNRSLMRAEVQPTLDAANDALTMLNEISLTATTTTEAIQTDQRLQAMAEWVKINKKLHTRVLKIVLRVAQQCDQNELKHICELILANKGNNDPQRWLVQWINTQNLSDQDWQKLVRYENSFRLLKPTTPQRAEQQIQTYLVMINNEEVTGNIDQVVAKILTTYQITGRTFRTNTNKPALTRALNADPNDLGRVLMNDSAWQKVNVSPNSQDVTAHLNLRDGKILLFKKENSGAISLSVEQPNT